MMTKLEMIDYLQQEYTDIQRKIATYSGFGGQAIEYDWRVQESLLFVLLNDMGILTA